MQSWLPLYNTIAKVYLVRKTDEQTSENDCIFCLFLPNPSSHSGSTLVKGV